MAKQLPVYDPKRKTPRAKRASRTASDLPVYNPKSHGSKVPVYDPKRKSAAILPAKAAKKKAGHGPFGLVKNFATDVGDTAVGIGPGLYKTGKAAGLDVADIIKHPASSKHFKHLTKDVFKPTIESYKQTYGPLAHGQFGKFAENVYQHPLGPLLDAATVASLGAGGAAKLGLVKTGRVEIAVRSPRAIVRGEGPTKTKLSDTKPLVRGRQTTVQKARQKLRYEAPLVGEAIQYGKGIARDARDAGLRGMPIYRDYLKATKNLSDREWVALNIRARDVHPADLAEAWKGTPNGDLVSDPRIQKLALAPTPRLARAEAASRLLSDEGRKVLQEQGLLRDETADARPAKTREQVSDILNSRQRPEPYVSRGHEGVGSIPDKARERGYLYHRTSVDRFEGIANGGLNPKKPHGPNPAGVYWANEPLQAESLSWKHNNNVYLRVARGNVPGLTERSFGESFSEKAVPARDLEYLGEDGSWYPVAPEARPVHGNPWYVPDVLEPIKNRSPLQAAGGGRGVPKIPGSSKLNQGVLTKLGLADVKHDVIGPEYLRRLKLRVHTAIHEDLLDGAHRMTADELRTSGLPQGYEFVRSRLVKGERSAAPHVGTPQKVGATLKREGEKLNLKELVPNPDDLHDSKLSEPLGTINKADAQRDKEGNYYIQPARTIRAAAGEFARSSKAVRDWWERPTKVWRALILGTRPAYVVNNIIGQHLLYSIQSAGHAGLKSYLEALRDAKGKGAVRRLLRNPDTPPQIRQQFMREFFPDQLEGTFGRTQSPARNRLGRQASGKTRRKASTYGMGLIPAAQSASEVVPRNAMVRSVIRSTPEFKQAAKKLRKETRNFEAIARKVIRERGPDYQKFVSDKVNHSLGSYLDLAPAERGVVRQLLPFYAWYRTIARATYHLAVDTPGRANALAKLGQIGSDDVERLYGPLPSYLKGVIPIGGTGTNTPTVLGTQGANPFATLTQVGRGVTSDYSGLGVHPALAAMLETAGQAQHGKIGGGALVANALKSVGEGVPLYRLLNPPPSSEQYPEKDRLTEILAQLGAPVKKPNLPVAHQRAREGR